MANMKSLDDVKLDMSTLYEEVRASTINLKTASELANITGKYLKAVQLEHNKEVFVETKRRLMMGDKTPRAIIDARD